ncbi:MAG: carboxypeptidase-like regulatory domain-containing protein [Pyrinomonadaceae bacterium]
MGSDSNFKYRMRQILNLTILSAVFAVSLFWVPSFTQGSGLNSTEMPGRFVCSPVPVGFGDLTNGTLENSDCVDVNAALFDRYTFTGTAGQSIEIVMTSAAFVPSLRLVQGNYPGGTLLATGTDPGNGSRLISAFTLPVNGDYTIVTSSNAPSGVGDYTMRFEPTIPRVDVIQRTSPNPNMPGSTVGYSVFFNTAVTGVDPADFTLTTTGVSGASIISINGSGTIFTVSVNSGSGTGTLRLDLIDNDTIVNGLGTKLGGTGAGNGSFNGPAYTIAASTPTPSPTPPPNTLVVTNTNDSGAGSLRQAINDVASGGNVGFSQIFSSPQTILLKSELRILKNITITGTGPQLLTISGNNVSRVFNIGQANPGNAVVITGVRIVGGRAPDGDFGGAIEQNFGTLSLVNCELTGNSAPANSAGSGGAIDILEGTLTVTDSKISDNSASVNGGGIAAANTAVTITNTTIAGNTSGGGGGLHIFGGTALISGSTFNSNVAGNRGGAIFAQNCGLTIVNSTISGNSGDATTKAVAGAIAFEATSGTRIARITSSTVANNSATANEVGAIVAGARGNASTSVTVEIVNSILASNSEPAMQSFATGGSISTISSRGFNLSTSTGNGYLNQTSDRTNAIAGLAPLGNNGGLTQTHRLLAQSAAIDAGNGFNLTTDQRGGVSGRTVDLSFANATGGDGTDIGAFELQSEPPPAMVSIGGRVTTPTGLGLRNTTVVLTDPQGIRRTATTSSFGIFSFANVPTGVTYVVGVSSKRYRFTAQSISPTSNLSNIDFVGLE